MPEITHIVRIDAPLETVFAAVGRADSIRHWFTPARAERDETGASMVLEFGDEEVELVVSERLEPRRVAWRCVAKDNGWYDTEIVFELERRDDTTLLRFDHRGWTEASDFMRSCSMSWAYFLESLRLYLETGTGTPESVAPPCDARAS